MSDSKKLILFPKEDKSITMTIRIERSLQAQYTNLADRINCSRNELINLALKYALDNMEIKD